jgi:hypothetical protein
MSGSSSPVGEPTPTLSVGADTQERAEQIPDKQSSLRRHSSPIGLRVSPHAAKRRTVPAIGQADSIQRISRTAIIEGRIGRLGPAVGSSIQYGAALRRRVFAVGRHTFDAAEHGDADPGRKEDVHGPDEERAPPHEVTASGRS